MSGKLLTEAELELIEKYRQTVNFPENTARLIADHRRMREAIRQRRHADYAGYCHWAGGMDTRTIDHCALYNCIWLECQP